jgi:hypothetical protein
MYAIALATFLLSVVTTLLISMLRRFDDRRYELITVTISGVFVASLLLPRDGGRDIGLTCLFPSVESLLILVACGLLVSNRARGGLRLFAILTGYYVLTFAGAYHQFAYEHGKAPFVVQGTRAALGRLDAVYFALETALPTSFGDISPNTSTVRGVVSMQLVTGFVLFGCLLVRALDRSGKGDR